MLYLLLALVVAICSQNCNASEGCQAPIILAKDMPPSVELPIIPQHHRSKRAEITKLRILLDYQNSFNAMPGSNFIKTNIIEVAKAKIEAAVKAKNPLSSALLVDRSCENSLYRRNTAGTIGCATGCVSQTTCLNVPVPDKYLKQCTTLSSSGTVFTSGSSGVGVSDTDLVILVTSEACSSNTTIAYANGCFLEKSLDRPILGVLNLCAAHFPVDSQVIQNVAVIQHEIIHILGFTVDKYAYYRFRNGNARVKRSAFNFPNNGLHSIGVYDWTSDIAKTVSRTHSFVGGTNTLSMTSFTLPNVVKAAREHFNCPTLGEVDLEDAGSLGSSYSHFDEYFLNEEMMTPTVNTFTNVLSDMTLALLHDTGWYDADFSKSEYLEYGKNKGCDFPTMGCYKYMKSQSDANQPLAPFCNSLLEVGNKLQCSTSKKYYENCDLRLYSSVAPQYRYFTNSLVAGANLYNEYCPVYATASNPSFNCEDTLNTGKSSIFFAFSNYFGSDSKCFATNSNSNDTYYGAACMKYQCNMATSQYSVTYNGNTYQCTDTNEHIISSSNDTLKCASFASVCQYTPPTKTTFQPIPDSSGFLKCNYSFIIMLMLVLFIMEKY